MDRVVTNKKIPSVIAGGLKDGKRWSYATGTASYEIPRPVEPNFSFRIGSITKAFTASVVLQLAEEKQLNLDDSVEKWLPGVVQGNGYDGNKITIRQLLNHTSGIATNIDKDMRDFTLPQNPFRYYSTDELISLALAKYACICTRGGLGLFEHKYCYSWEDYSKGNRRYVCEAN